MAEEKKPKPYSRKRQGTKVLKGDAQAKEKISVPVKNKEPEPKEEVKVTTPKGKEYQVVQSGYGYKVEFTTGGQIPKELAGSYTKQRKAWEAIEAYEAKRG